MSKAIISVNVTDMCAIELTRYQLKITPLNDKMYLEMKKQQPRVEFKDGKPQVFIDKEVDL